MKKKRDLIGLRECCQKTCIRNNYTDEFVCMECHIYWRHNDAVWIGKSVQDDPIDFILGHA